MSGFLSFYGWIVFYYVFITLRCIPRSGIARSYGISIILIFGRTYILFSILAASIYILTGNVQGFPFPHSQPHKHFVSIVLLIIAIITHLRWCLLGFWFSFPWLWVILSIFSYTCRLFKVICMSTLERCLCRFFIHFLLPYIFLSY